MEQKSATNGGSDRAANIGSRKRARAFPKGRQLDGDALREVRELLGSRPRRPDLLIEFLHLIQDRYHHLSARHLRALCEEMRLPQAAVYEVATFYSHFDVVKEGETPPPPTTIRVCNSITCELKGAEALLDALEARSDPTKVRVLRAPCMGRCDTAPVCEIGHLHVDHATVESGRGRGLERRERGEDSSLSESRRVSRRRRLFRARELSLWRAEPQLSRQGIGRCEPTWPWRCRFPDRTQMADRAVLSRPEIDDHQWRRRRARHL